MSLVSAVSLVPEMLLNTPRSASELESAIAACVGAAFVRVFRGGCIVTVRGGQGVVFRKRKDGSWSAPCSVGMCGPAIGASIGLEMTDAVILFTEECALKAFVDGSMTMGLNGNITLGPLGREGEHLIGTGFNGGLLVMSSAKGIYGGVSLEFSGFKASRTANVAHYGRSIDAAEILDSEPAPSGDAFARAYKALAKFSQPVQQPVA